MALLILIGIPFLTASLLGLMTYFAKQSEHWPSVKGKIVKFEIESRKYQSKFPSLQEEYTMGLLKVKYEYTVDSNVYINSRVVFMNDYFLPIENIAKDELIEKIKTDDFDVYYYDKFPKFSVLKKGYDEVQSNIFCILFILAVGAFAYFFYAVVWDYLQLPRPK